MGCDIHLRVERRRRKNPYPNDRHEWYDASIYGTFSCRIYGMFARMAGVRDYDNKKMFEPRGLPEDMSWTTKQTFYMHVTENKNVVEWGENFCLKENAERWVEEGWSKWGNESHTTVTDPDHHSHSWLTTQEMRQCFDDCFKNEDGTFDGDYVDWLGLVSMCEGIESTGEFECRVVFSFDN